LVGSFSADIANIVDAITIDGPADAAWNTFFGVMCTNNAQVHGFGTSW